MCVCVRNADDALNVFDAVNHLLLHDAVSQRGSVGEGEALTPPLLAEAGRRGAEDELLQRLELQQG